MTAVQGHTCRMLVSGTLVVGVARIFVSTNSTLMDFVSSPGDLALGATVRRVANPLEEARLGFFVSLILVHHLADGFGHDCGHRLVARSRVGAELTEQSPREAQRDVLMIAHENESIACLRENCLHTHS